MFTGFFYLLRAHGFRVSLNEWMTLIEGLMLDLQHDSLTGFYELCRAVLVKSEADYDKFDQIFLEYFDGVPYQDELPKELMDWLNNPAAAMEEFRKFLRTQGYEEKSIEEILKMFEERLKEQTEEHNGGSYWIGTNGYSNFGNSGHSPQCIRVGGKSMYRRAFQVAGERRFRDFRKDNVLDIRQFQMAFRLLRQYSEQTQEAKTEFDVDGTVRETCDNAGTLSVCYKRPRKNTVKVLMLMDSGGSMEYYSNLCSMLFQAARQSNHFKELHVYYFHNCIYSSVYTDPRMYREHAPLIVFYVRVRPARCPAPQSGCPRCCAWRRCGCSAPWSSPDAPRNTRRRGGCGPDTRYLSRARPFCSRHRGSGRSSAAG